MSPPLTRITIGAGLIAGFGALLVADVFVDRWAGAAVAPAFWVLLFVALEAGCWEFARMLRLKGHPCQPKTAACFVALMVAGAWIEVHARAMSLGWLYEHGLDLYLLLVIGLVFTAFVTEILLIERSGADMGRAMASVGWTVLVVLTVGLPGAFLAKLRFLLPDTSIDGLLYLVLTIGVIKVGDIGAYAVGSTLGRHLLVPRLSPRKTVEGLAGAAAGGLAAALAIGCLWGRFTWPQMLVFGAAVSVAGVLGDLGESLVKRACGVKDSGPIPGFGGALDILDSILGGAPVAYLVLAVLTGGR